MVNKSVNRNRILVLLEIVFLGMLVWVVLSGLLFRQDSTVQASRAGGENQGTKQMTQERTVPQEGVAVPNSTKILAAIGTPNACQGFDFVGGATQGFTVQNVEGAAPLWHLTNGSCRASLAGHSTPFTFYYGQEATCNYNTGARNASNLISPAISVAGIFPPYSIGFNYLLFVEGGGFDTTFTDLSTDGGATWTQILSKANLIDDNQWHNVATDVTANVGSATSIKLRFRFDSVDNIANSTTGWHVDDVLVCGQQFNFCVQDNNTGDYIQFNSVTGVYVTKQCRTGFTAGGVGTVTTNGCLVTLQQNSGGQFNSVTVDTCNHTGSAKIRSVNGFSIVAYDITDSNTTNNTCSCP